MYRKKTEYRHPTADMEEVAAQQHMIPLKNEQAAKEREASTINGSINKTFFNSQKKLPSSNFFPKVNKNTSGISGFSNDNIMIINMQQSKGVQLKRGLSQ